MILFQTVALVQAYQKEPVNKNAQSHLHARLCPSLGHMELTLPWGRQATGLLGSGEAGEMLTAWGVR